MKQENFVQIMKGIRDTLSLQKPLLDINEAAFYMGVERNYLYRLTSKRKIKHFKSKGGKKIYFKKEDLEAWMTFLPIKPI